MSVCGADCSPRLPQCSSASAATGQGAPGALLPLSKSSLPDWGRWGSHMGKARVCVPDQGGGAPTPQALAPCTVVAWSRHGFPPGSMGQRRPPSLKLCCNSKGCQLQSSFLRNAGRTRLHKSCQGRMAQAGESPRRADGYGQSSCGHPIASLLCQALSLPCL